MNLEGTIFCLFYQPRMRNQEYFTTQLLHWRTFIKYKEMRTTKQPKLGSLWVKPEHLSEHKRIVAGLKATIDFLLSNDFYASKRIRQLTEDNNRLKSILRAKFDTFEEYDILTKLFS